MLEQTGIVAAHTPDQCHSAAVATVSFAQPSLYICSHVREAGVEVDTGKRAGWYGVRRPDAGAMLKVCELSKMAGGWNWRALEDGTSRLQEAHTTKAVGLRCQKPTESVCTGD
jgi:hypothetical protein